MAEEYKPSRVDNFIDAVKPWVLIGVLSAGAYLFAKCAERDPHNLSVKTGNCEVKMAEDTIIHGPETLEAVIYIEERCGSRETRFVLAEGLLFGYNCSSITVFEDGKEVEYKDEKMKEYLHDKCYAIYEWMDDRAE
jgi:hypothetical protein